MPRHWLKLSSCVSACPHSEFYECTAFTFSFYSLKSGFCLYLYTDVSLSLRGHLSFVAFWESAPKIFLLHCPEVFKTIGQCLLSWNSSVPWHMHVFYLLSHHFFSDFIPSSSLSQSWNRSEISFPSILSIRNLILSIVSVNIFLCIIIVFMYLQPQSLFEISDIRL